MKEVDFRGKDINTGDWIYGSYVADYTISDSYSSYIRPNYGQTVEEMYAIDFHTLGQFIGLYDRNANRIFEGISLDVQVLTRILQSILYNMRKNNYHMFSKLL